MSVTRLENVIVPVEFTSYLVQNIMKKSALFQSGVAVKNDLITEQLRAGAESFNVPYWMDLSDTEANIINDDPSQHSTPQGLNAIKQLVRKSFNHQSWSAMNLASELSGDDAMQRIKDRVAAYWTRQMQSRLISSLKGIMKQNIASDDSDMVYDASSEALSGKAVIRAAATLGDHMETVKAIAMHSSIYTQALENNEIEFVRDSEGSLIMPAYKGLGVIVDDELLPDDDGVYTSILFGMGAVGFGVSDPRIADGTEIENTPSAGMGGGQSTLHSRINNAIHPLGFSWTEQSVAGQSPSIAELADPLNWKRTVERKAAPIAFLLTK